MADIKYHRNTIITSNCITSFHYKQYSNGPGGQIANRLLILKWVKSWISPVNANLKCQNQTSQTQISIFLKCWKTLIPLCYIYSTHFFYILMSLYKWFHNNCPTVINLTMLWMMLLITKIFILWNLIPELFLSRSNQAVIADSYQAESQTVKNHD